MDSEQAQQIRIRILFVGGLFVVATLAIITSLAHWQLFEEPRSNITGLSSILAAPRGNIFDSNGHLLATDIPEYDVKFSPTQVERLKEDDRIEIAEQLAGKLQLRRSDVLKKIENFEHNKNYQPLTTPGVGRVSQDVMESLDKIAGVGFDMFYQRTYPEGQLAAQVIGFTQQGYAINKHSGITQTVAVGQYGIERKYDDILQGTAGYVNPYLFLPEVIADAKQHTAAIPGADIYLTINRAVQKLVEDEIATAVETYAADSGRVLVMNPRTGEVLAMANYPTFDPNNYSASASQLERFNNDIISAVYEPGSVFKAITMAGALDVRAVSSVSTVNDTGSITIGDKTIYNSDRKAHGVVNMTDVLAQSLNVGTAQIAERMQAENFFWYVDAFGFGSRTGIDLAGEVTGNYPKPGTDGWFRESHAFVSFGQGIAVTPLQMLTAMSAIANHGIRMKPYVVEKIVQHNPETITETVPQSVNQPISAETAGILTQMMVNALNKAKSAARIDGYTVAGKTGTAQVPLPGGQGYDPYKTIQSFAGYFPANDPQVAILVILDNPKYAEFGSYTAAPTFSEIGSQIARILDIQPDIPEVARAQ